MRSFFVDECFNVHATPINDMQLHMYPETYNPAEVCIICQTLTQIICDTDTQTIHQTLVQTKL